MPLEIRELVVRTHVTTETTLNTSPKEHYQLAERERQQIVADCVHLIMRKMRKRKER